MRDDERNVSDAVDGLSRMVQRVADSICIDDIGHDESGGTVGSLTEAVMGMTAGLFSIADSIRDLAEAVREQNDQ